MPGLLLLRRGPASYTGEDLAEIQCPGNPALLERLVHLALDAGARLAEPGEFTFRAFLARRIDLTQAEGIAATIAATSDGQLRAAALLRRGELGRFAAASSDAISGLLALVEAGIDFVDQDDVQPIGAAELARRLGGVADRLQDLLDRSRAWRTLEALPAVVLAGAPGAGKSTLFNALLGRRRALTGRDPGTTRDVLAEPLCLRSPDGHRFEVLLVDIAGLDEPASALDRQAQDAARLAIETADLVVHVLSGADGAGSAPRFPAAPALRVRTKADLAPEPVGSFDVAVSGRTGRGVAELRRAIAARVSERGSSLAADTLALQPRHDAALRAAGAHLAEARRLLEAESDPDRLDRPELVAASLRGALDELDTLAGRLTPDDILGRVFATFCIGK